MGRILARSVKFVDFQIKNDSDLVRCVKSYPIIYDKRNLLSPNRKVLRRIWEYIAKNLQSTAKECEDRWRTLLDIYEKCKILGKHGTSIIMHDVLIEQLDDLLSSIPEDLAEDITYGEEAEECMLYYDLPQTEEEMNDDPSSPIHPELPEQEHSFIFLPTTKEVFEDGFGIEANFSELLDEACALPPSKTYKGI